MTRSAPGSEGEMSPDRLVEKSECRAKVAEGPDWSFLLAADLEHKLHSHWSRMVWRAFEKFIPQGCRLLEIGCGSGKLCVQAGRYREAGAFGVDVDRRAVDYAGRLADFVGVPRRFCVTSGFALPFADGAFDVVLSEGVIEHFSPALTGQMVAEHARVCRAGGRVLIAVPNLLNVPLSYHKLRTGKHYHAYPERSYTIWGLAGLMRTYGLQPIACSGFAPCIGLEWFIHKRLRCRWFDLTAPDWLQALVGYEVLVAAERVGRGDVG